MNGTCLQCSAVFKKKYHTQKFCSVVCSNRKNLNNKNIFVLPAAYSVELAELFGILLGDGSVFTYFVRIYLNLKVDAGYSKNIIQLIKKVFPNATTSTLIRPARGTEEIQISSKDICDYFRSIGFDPKIRTVPFWITENIEYSKATLRGLFDTEGSIGTKYFRGKKGDYVYKQLTFTNKNPGLLKFVEQTLVTLGFSPTKNSRTNIYISNKADTERYFKVIKPHNPKLEKNLKMIRMNKTTR